MSSAHRHQITLPSIDLPTAVAMAADLEQWMVEEGLANRGKGLDPAFADDEGKPAVGLPLGPKAQRYLGDVVEIAPVCVQARWELYPTYFGGPNPVSACSVCGRGTPDEPTMIAMGIYERWLREHQVPEVRCDNCGHVELLTDRNLDNVDVVTPLAITSSSLGFVNHLLDEMPEEFRPEDWFISTTKM